MASPSAPLCLPLSSSSASIVRRCAPTLLHLLQTRFQCEAEILGLDPASDFRPGALVVPEKRLETRLPSGVKVSVWRGDLTNFSAAAVVNAANSKLSHGGGLALALSEAGGAQIQRESDDFVRNHGEVKTGDAVALTGGKLRCEVIIHAVGPRLGFRPNAHEVSAARPQLERAVCSILEIVDRKRLETVAIPALSSGIFNFPVDDSADTIVTTIREFYSSSRSHRFKPREVFLVNNDEPTVSEMKRACLKLLPPPASVSSTQTTSSGNKPSPSDPLLYSQAAAGAKPHSSASGPQTRGAKSKTAPPEVQLGLVRVLLRKGRLEEQKTDVIVNTASENRDLSFGRVSNALLMKAGRKMQEEIKQAFPYNSILITKSYNLQCRQVYHTFCPERSREGSPQVLFRSMQDCLMSAVSCQHHSIAFPAIGTGALGFRNREAAQIMLTAVNDFAPRCPVHLEVHLVIFQHDADVFKAFEEELQSLQLQVKQAESPSGFTGATQNNKPAVDRGLKPDWSLEPQSTSTEPSLRLHSSSEQSRAEAETWLQTLLESTVQFNLVCINNNFTQHLGDRELEELSETEVEGVRVEEFLEKGRSGLVVSGDRAEDTVVAAVKLQEMLQTAQRQFLKEEVVVLKTEAQMSVKLEKIPASSSETQIKPFVKELRRHGLQVVKAERVENPALEKVFKRRKAKMSPHVSWDMLQLVPAQFCDLVGHVGFRPECAPPDDSSLGEGLYFAADVQTALRLWTERSERFLYLFVAEVLKGRSGRGKPGLVLAPGLDSERGPEPRTRCDSVEESGVTVIFDHRQSLPRFILTCHKDILNSPV